MTSPDTSRWTPVGRTSNMQFFRLETGILGAVPYEGVHDDGHTARENCEFQNHYFKQHGPGVNVFFIDPMVSQDKDARRAYRELPDPRVFLGAALIGETLLARAISSFFVGIARPRVPFRMFMAVDEALDWARDLLVKDQRSRPS